MFVLLPAAGLSKFSTPIGREILCSGGVEEGGGVGRIDTPPCTDGGFGGSFCEPAGEFEGIAGRSRAPEAGALG